MPFLFADHPRAQLLSNGAESYKLATGLPVIRPGSSLQFPSLDCATKQEGEWSLQRKGGFFLAATSQDATHLDETLTRAYRQFLDLCSNSAVYRVWHFVPQINEEKDGLENYRLFCRIRHDVLRSFAGEVDGHLLPAASAVGTTSKNFSMLFLAGQEPAQAIENSLQVPAYEYPAIYGPRPPAFARAATVGNSLFVSGTSSIRGHKTVATGDLQEQTTVTLENIANLLSSLHLSPAELSAPEGALTVYLRDGTRLSEIDQQLTNAFPNIEATILEADICRRDLEVEIELHCLDVNTIQKKC